MIPKFLKITNRLGESITFGNEFRLNEDIDFSNLTATVNYSDSGSDGANYQSTNLNIRDFDIPFYIDIETDSKQWIEDTRAQAFRVFNPKLNPFRVDFVTDGDYEYYVMANLEGAPSFPPGIETETEGWQIGLLQFTADDPHIYQKAITTVQVALWQGTFKFPLVIPKDVGITMGVRAQSLIVNVFNQGNSDTGMLIRFKALSSVSNPSLININTYEELNLTIDMESGDEIEVSTYKGKRTIMLIRNNVKTDIFNSLDFLTSEFLQLTPGDNLLRYDAASGIDGLEVTIIFTARYVGV